MEKAPSGDGEERLMRAILKVIRDGINFKITAAIIPLSFPRGKWIYRNSLRRDFTLLFIITLKGIWGFHRSRRSGANLE